jgi:glycine/D-amino acid oxidase-like deaminating enzyme
MTVSLTSTPAGYDVAVVGGGVMGATTALFLARGGMRCALIERRGLCSEASGVNAGTLTMNMTRAALIPYALEGWRMWTGCLDWLGSDPGVTAAPGLSLAFTADEAELLRQRAAARREMGADIRLIGVEQARAIEPGLNDKVLLAAHCPIDGHVTANRTGHAYRRALVREPNIDLYENSPVDAISHGDHGFALSLPALTLRSRRLVLAGGVWLERMLGWLGVDIPIKTLINQLVVTERLRPVMRSVLSIANGLLSLKQFANGTVLIGGGWQGSGDRERHTSDIIPDHMLGNVRLARYVIPALAETRIVRAWLGFEAETADAMPLLGEVPGIADAYVIGSVHSGYTSGPYMGKLLAQRILGHEPELPLFDPARLLD